MTLPTLEVLAIQAQQIRQQLDVLRGHITTHRTEAHGDAFGHLDHAQSFCFCAADLALSAKCAVLCAQTAQVAEAARKQPNVIYPDDVDHDAIRDSEDDARYLTDTERAQADDAGARA